MSITVEIEEIKKADEIPIIRINIPGEAYPCKLRVDFPTLRKLCPAPSPVILDLLTLSATIYALDRQIFRESATDNWTRKFPLILPVSELDVWMKVKPTLEKCLSFLTGDEWTLAFTQRSESDKYFTQTGLSISPPANAVSLFSGGLDSLIGVIDWLEGNPNQSLILVGHHDPRIPGTLHDQKKVFNALRTTYKDRISENLIFIGASTGYDTTTRSRSLLFLALGIFAASSISANTPLLIPENGNMSLNVPLSPSRGGSCSTRTTHPYFLSLIRKVLSDLGIFNPLNNTLELKTKGECVIECLNQHVLRDTFIHTSSCAKRGHKSTWIRRNARECGRCLPCIYRRAALHKRSLDSQIYGRDICTGEVDPNATFSYTEDFRALLLFLRQNHTKAEIIKKLCASGKIEISRIEEYADLVLRAMDEVRVFLADKSVDNIKRFAGL